MGYVNVGKGNFTFVRRDLVTVGRVPVIFARVYDSAYGGPTDFSGGWRLGVAEVIRSRPDGSLAYLDDRSTVTRFVRAESGYRISPAQPSDIAALEAAESGFLITYRNGWTKRFKLLGGAARLVRIADNNGNTVKLHYDDQNRLKRIQGQNGRYVRIERDDAGRITRIEDDQGRQVAYGYSQQGILQSVSDLGGNDWTYEYTDGALSRVTDPLGHTAAAVEYHEEGRVKSTRIYHAETHYNYEGRNTVVHDNAGNASTFMQNADGITVGITNPEGYTSRISLTDQNKVRVLEHQGNLRGEFDYDNEGKLSRLVRYDLEGAVELTYRYDWEKRVLDILGTDGSQRVLTYDEQGNLLSETEDDTATAYVYNNQGDIVRKAIDGEVTKYRHDRDGLLTEISRGDMESVFR